MQVEVNKRTASKSNKLRKLYPFTVTQLLKQEKTKIFKIPDDMQSHIITSI